MKFPFLIGKVLTKTARIDLPHEWWGKFPFLIGKVLTEPTKPGRDPEPTVSIPYR